jgi:hypothetical protein
MHSVNNLNKGIIQMTPQEYNDFLKTYGKNATLETIQSKLHTTYVYPPRDPQSLCTTGGMIPYQLFVQNEIFARLGYRVEKAVEEEYIRNDSWKENFRSRITNPRLLGILINVPGHYVAVIKYSGIACKEGDYVFADSMNGSILQCKPLDTIIKSIKPRQMYYIYADSPDSYKSVSVRRMPSLGGKRSRLNRRLSKTRKTKARSNTKHSKTRSSRTA